jgi:Domain of unknown function (DUF5655)
MPTEGMSSRPCSCQGRRKHDLRIAIAQNPGRMTRSHQPLWRCPSCGQSFVTRSMPHSCDVRPLDEHFAGVKPELREAFDALVSTVRENGPVTVNAAKSRIAFQGRGRFAGIDRPRKDHLVASFLLTRAVRSPRLARVDYIPPYYYVHRLRLHDREEIDDEVRGWLAEAYQVGRQSHVGDPEWPKERRPPAWVRVPRQVAEAMARGDDPSKVR